MTFRILTANVFFGRVSASTLEQLVERHSPDAMAVQELVPPLDTTLHSLFGYGAVAPRDEHLSIGLFSSRPMTFDQLPLASHPALIGRLGEELEIIAVHLPAPQTLPPWTTFRLRGEDVAALSAFFAQDSERGRILIGDLNSPPLWPAYRRLSRHLQDAPVLVTRRTGSRPARTWGPWVGSPRLFRIDHVLVSGIRPQATSVVPLPGSDHSAVIVDFAL